MARGQKTVLLVEEKAGEHKLLADRLQKTKSSLKVVAVSVPAICPRTRPSSPLVLSRFD